MSETYAHSERLQCPVCKRLLRSRQEVEECTASHDERIVEVFPPRKANRANGGENDTDPDFFPMVSAAHEFKTPLVVMLGYTDLLRNGHLGPVNDRQRQVLEEIQESAERLQNFIRDLLFLYELRASKNAVGAGMEGEPAEVNDDLKEIFDFWASAAKQKAISYTFHSAPHRVRVNVESMKLQHIVSNLIENAIKFTPAKGKVWVTVTPCFWDRRKAQTELLFNLDRKVNRKIENAVRIDVRDTGPGIPADRQEEIFHDFVQLPGASSRGTGLGLAIARRLTAAHGGAIWVESEKGKGSRFSLLLSSSK